MTLPPREIPLRLSVILPAYNEAARIRPYLESIGQYVERRGTPAEILVVDDGSDDRTDLVVARVQAALPMVRLLRLDRNSGKGAAVRNGVLEARGATVLIADADGATAIPEIERLEAAIEKGADLAIGSRFLGSHDPRYRVLARWHRSALGNLFNAIVQRLGIAGLTDTQCGFKLFRQTAARDLFSLARVNGYGFDLEILYLAQRRGYRISEVPINWTDQPGSKVRVLPDGLRMLRDLLRVRRDYSKGLYA
jgi:dolichyl-phosphate beta-glucosyltransferase